MFVKMKNSAMLLIILEIFLLTVEIYGSNSTDESLKRQKRTYPAIVYTLNAATGVRSNSNLLVPF